MFPKWQKKLGFLKKRHTTAFIEDGLSVKPSILRSFLAGYAGIQRPARLKSKPPPVEFLISDVWYEPPRPKPMVIPLLVVYPASWAVEGNEINMRRYKTDALDKNAFIIRQDLIKQDFIA